MSIIVVDAREKQNDGNESDWTIGAQAGIVAEII